MTIEIQYKDRSLRDVPYVLVISDSEKSVNGHTVVNFYGMNFKIVIIFKNNN